MSKPSSLPYFGQTRNGKYHEILEFTIIRTALNDAKSAYTALNDEEKIEHVEFALKGLEYIQKNIRQITGD